MSSWTIALVGAEQVDARPVDTWIGLTLVDV